MPEVSPYLRPLLHPLEVCRVRFQLQRGLELGSWVLLVVLGLGVLLRLCNYLPGTEVAPAVATWIGLGCLALGWTAVVVYLWRTAPTVQKIAQIAEQKLKLQERLSTVLEVDHRTSNLLQSLIHQALLVDTLRHLAQLQPARVVPFKLPRPSRYILGVLVLVLLMNFFLKPAGTALTQTTRPDQAQVAVADALERLIQEVQQDAERTSDPYLRAETRNLEQLRTQIKQGKIAGEALQRELGASLSRLGQSYGISPTDSSANADPATREAHTALPNPVQAGQVGSVNPGQTAQRSLQQFTQRLQAQRQNPSGKAPANPDELSRECIYIEGYECLSSAQVAKLQEELASSSARVRVKAPEGGTPGGSGDKAGKGAQAKLGGQQTLEAKTAAQQVMLPKHAPSSSQRRIQISAPTELARTLEQAGGAAGDWHFAEELPQPSGLQALGPEDRAAVSRYFARSEE